MQHALRVLHCLVKRQLLLSVAVFFCALLSSAASVQAGSINFYSTSDWEEGTLSNLDTGSVTDALQLEATGTWDARNWKTPDQPLGIGATFASDGTSVYVIRGLGDILFWKYDSSTDTWTQLADLPGGAYYGSDLVYLDGYVYAILGGFQNTFARYSPQTNTWQLMEEFPALPYTGTSLATDGTDIFALRGYNSQEFYKYSVGSNSWTPLTGPPLTINTGSDLVYLDGYLYTPRGVNTTTFYRYNISTNQWSSMAVMPATLNGETNIDTDGTNIFLTRQSNTTTFYRYNVGANSWTTLPVLPAAAQFGGVVYVADEAKFFVFRGNSQYDFWKYDSVSNSFEGLTQMSTTLGNGSNIFYSGSYLYVLRGAASTTVNRLNLSSNVWEARAVVPATLGDDTKGVLVGTDYYVLRGSNTTTFYQYSTTGNAWTTLAVAPGTAQYGAALVYPGSGDYIYATRANLTTGFWRYSISTNTWSDVAVADIPTGNEGFYGSRLASDGTYIYYFTGGGSARLLRYSIQDDTWETVGALPFVPYWGTDVVYDDGRLIALAGHYKDELWEYDISLNQWRKLPPLSGYYAYNLGPYNGASIATDGAGTFYITYGQSLADIRTFSFGAENFRTSGTWTSAITHLGYVGSWTSFSSDEIIPGDAAVTYQTRTSADGETWEDWETVVGSTIASTPQSYVQVRALLAATTGGVQSPTVSEISIDYVGDSTAPTNPSTITAASQAVEGEALTSGESYRFTSPYFSWTGATDAQTAVAGYYVYFGTNDLADPESVGSFQEQSTYLVAKALSTGTYYLRIQTEDTEGNISAAETVFEYEYAGVSPPQSITAAVSADFTGTATDISASDDALELAGRDGGFWLESNLSLPPGAINYGARSFAYVSESNKLYVFRGTSTTFYEYDIATNTWTTLAAAPAAVNYGAGVIEGPDGYLYALQGANTTAFWRYDIAANTWSDVDASDTPLTVSYGSSLVYDGSQFIYITRGNNDDDFWRYDTLMDAWETLPTADFGAPATALTNAIFYGGDLAIDQTTGKIYAIQGNYQNGFSVFDTNTNSWSVLANLPSLPFYGATIEYDASTESLFYMPGNNTEYLYEYDIAAEEWTRKANAPAVFYYGSALRAVDGTLFALRGLNTTGFYSYSVAKDSWQLPNRGLFASVYRGAVTATQANQGTGADIVKGDGSNFYLIRGNYSDDFVRFNQDSGAVTRMSRLPAGAHNGSSLVYDSTQNKMYLGGGQYDQRFYSYDISTNTWEEITTDPPLATLLGGSSMVYDGSRYVYANRGGATNTFYRYDTQADAGTRWGTLATAPATLSNGAELLLNGGYIYTMRGANIAANPFYRYDIGANTWSTMSPLSVTVNTDGFLVDSGSGTFLAARGLNVSSMYEYSLAGNSWTQMIDASAAISVGAAAESNGVNKVFMMPGTGTNAYSDALYTYIMETETSGFVESGEYISQSHDFTDVYKWATLDVTYTEPTSTQVTISTRSSEDDAVWSAWTAVSAGKNIGSLHSYHINSPAARYLQVKYELTSAQGELSPVIQDYTVHFYRDTTAPSNPQNAGFSAYSNNTPGAAITSNSWYGHEGPHFTWAAAEATNGASDSTSGSGVAGYYVYFGTDAAADPLEEGTLQTGTSFTAEDLESGETYYLRIVTVDDAGNQAAAAWAPFIYKFDNAAPDQPVSLSVDPAGYTSTNSFDFSWEEVLDNGEPVQDYCYKTGASEGIYSVDQCTTDLSVTAVPAYRVGQNTFSVRSRDIAGNFSAYAAVLYYYVDSENAPAPPLNVQATPTSNTDNSFAFSWNHPATGTFYGSAANLSYRFAVNVENGILTEGNTTPTVLTNLIAGPYATKPGDNVFYIVTKDEAGNINYSDYASATFTANTVAPGIPVDMEIADVSVKSTESWRLALSWEAPTSGGDVGSYAVYRSTDGETFTRLASSSSSSYVDTRLEQETYYYKVQACDSTNNCGAFSDVVSLLPDGRYTEAAALTAEPTATGVTTKKATISWSTARTADSRISYGTGSGDYFDAEISNSEQMTFHTLTVPNLAPGTKYFYVVKWTDEDGNLGVSDEYSFETEPPPSTQEPVVRTAGLDSALIEFTSKNAQRVRVYYGETAAFGSLEDVVTGGAEGTHTVLLKDLTDGTKYFYKINSFDSDGEEYEGETHSFTTLPRPKLTNITINQVKGTAQSTLLVNWESNTPVSSIVTFYPLSAPSAARDEINLALKGGRHQMVLTGLEPQTTYIVVVRGRDAAGNEASGEIQQVATSTDTRPPSIADLKVDSEVLGTGEEATAQLIVSFVTDEPATAQIEYGEGSGSVYSMKTQEDSSLTNNHLVVISGLSPGKVYHLRAVSKDGFSNTAQSLDKVVITPKATENALDLVISNLSVTFGFLR